MNTEEWSTLKRVSIKIGAALTTGLTLVACSSTPTYTAPASTALPRPAVVVDNSPILFTEPSVSAPFYALNPIDYTQPPEYEVNLYRAATAPVTKLQVNVPSASTGTTPSAVAALDQVILDKNRFIIPTTNTKTQALRFAVLAQEGELDVTEMDDFLNLLEGKARHYPVRFNSLRERDGYTDRLKNIMSTLDPLAARTSASYDVLLRAMKASSMARNMDLGEIYGPKSLSYAKRLLDMNSQDPIVNFWLGIGLSEGGALKEALPYLQNAMNAGVQEAYLSSANNYINLEQSKNALITLRNYKVKYPLEAAVADRLITEIESGRRFNVWQVLK